MSAVAPFQKRTRIRLWDLPVRVFHWSLVLAVGTAVVTGELGGSWMTLHGQAGLAIVGLVVFRLVWGLIGSTHARFVRFAPTPGELKAYLRGRWAGVGHNPLGALSVFALLALLAVQAGTGLFSNDDIAFSGPLFNLVDEAFAGRLTGLHKQLANMLLALLALHIAAIAFYVGLKKDNLVKPMLTGWKDVETGESAQHGGPLAFIVALAIALAAVLAVSGSTPSSTGGQPAAAAAPRPAW
jgi:cytochrome b